MNKNNISNNNTYRFLLQMEHIFPRLLAGLLLGALTACAAPPAMPGHTTEESARRLEDDVTGQRVQREPELAAMDLERALRLYALVDQQRGQLRAHLKLVRVYLSLDNRSLAARHLARAERIQRRLPDSSMGFEVALLRAQMDNDSAGYATALTLAATPIQQALALAYLGRTAEAWERVQPGLTDLHGNEGDFAYVALAFAREHRDMAAARLALRLYKRADSHRGIARALETLADLNREAGHMTLHREFSDRARTVRRALEVSGPGSSPP